MDVYKILPGGTRRMKNQINPNNVITWGDAWIRQHPSSDDLFFLEGYVELSGGKKVCLSKMISPEERDIFEREMV